MYDIIRTEFKNKNVIIICVCFACDKTIQSICMHYTFYYKTVKLSKRIQYYNHDFKWFSTFKFCISTYYAVVSI